MSTQEIWTREKYDGILRTFCEEYVGGIRRAINNPAIASVLERHLAEQPVRDVEGIVFGLLKTAPPWAQTEELRRALELQIEFAGLAGWISLEELPKIQARLSEQWQSLKARTPKLELVRSKSRPTAARLN